MQLVVPPGYPSLTICSTVPYCVPIEIQAHSTHIRQTGPRTYELLEHLKIKRLHPYYLAAMVVGGEHNAAYTYEIRQ